MNRKYGLALALLTLAACDKKEAPPVDTTEKPSTAATPPAPPTPVAAATPVDLDSLPVEEEFEGEAEKELTSANLNAKLDELEKEISAP